MKIKHTNIILIAVNIMMLIIAYCPIILDFATDTLQISSSIFGIYGEFEKITEIIMCLSVLLFILNLLAIINNKKNKKFLIWSVVPIIYFLGSMLSFLTPFSIPEKLWSIFIAIVFIIAIILELRKNKRKKHIIFYILAVLLSFATFFIDFYTSMIWFIIASVMQFIYNKEIEGFGKIWKILNTILLALICVIIIFTLGFITYTSIKLYNIDNESAQFIEQINTNINKEQLHKKALILVNRDNKWGYINTEGKEIIPCKYDSISGIWYSYDDDISTVFIAKYNDSYEILSNNGTVLALNKEASLPFIKGKVVENLIKMSKDAVNPENTFLSLVAAMLQEYIDNSSIKTVDYENKMDYIEPVNSEYNEDFIELYTYNLNNGNILRVEECIKSISEYSYNMYIYKKDNTFENINDISLSFTYDNNIETYSNGDIPFYNFEKKLQGFYSLQEQRILLLNGDYCILDVINNNIIVRDYTDKSNTKDFIIDLKTREILLTGKTISAYEHGYIVENFNGELLYLDKYFNKKISGFDIMEVYDIKVDVIVCGKINNNFVDYELYDLNGNKLTDYTYNSMGDIETTDIEVIKEKGYLEHDSKSYLFNNKYFQYYNE